MRKLVMLACVGLAGAAVAILPSLGAAQAPAASFTATDTGTFFEPHFWYVTGTTTSAVSIAPGGTVFFGYPSGVSSHSAVFTGPQPSACTQASAPTGYRSGPAPPLPQDPEPAGWSGSCRFDAAGTYTFHCALHGEAMSGTINVGAAGTTQPPTTTQPPPGTGGETTTTYGFTPFPAAAGSLGAAAVQRGTVVRGQIHVTTPSSRVVADLLAGRPPARLGRTTLHGVSDGTKHFTVRLYASAARALRRHHRLSLLLRVQVLGQGLGPTTLSRHVTLVA